MKWFYDLKIATKLISSFIVVLILTAAMGTFSIFQLAKVNAKANEIKNDWMPSMRAAQAARYYGTYFRVREARYIMTDKAEEKAAIEAGANELLKEMDIRIANYEKLINTDEERKLLDRFIFDWKAYMVISRTVQELTRQQKNEEARLLFSEKSKDAFDTAMGEIQKLIELDVSGADVAGAQGDKIYASARIAIISALIAALVLGLALAFDDFKNYFSPVNFGCTSCNAII